MPRRLRFKLCDSTVYPGEDNPEDTDPPSTPTGNEATTEKAACSNERSHPTYSTCVARLPSYSLLREDGPIRAIVSDDIKSLHQAFRCGTIEADGLFSRDGTPALMVATAFNNRTVMRILIDEGFDVNTVAPSGQYAGLSPLHLACSLGHTSAFNLLTTRGADLAARTVSSEMDTGGCGQTGLHLAVQRNHTYLCNIIVSMDRELVDIPDSGGLTPLHVSCALGHLSIARLLLRSGCDVNVRDNNNMTPITHAILRKQHQAARLLMGIADLNIKCLHNSEFGSGLAPLHLATILGEEELVRELLDNGSDPHQFADSVPINRWKYNHETMMPVHIAAMKGNVEIFETLSRKDPADDATTHTNRLTPLCLAAASNQYQMVRYLLSSGCDVSHTVTIGDNRNYTALHIAADMGWTDIVEHLLLKKADPNTQTITSRGHRDQTPLSLAYRQGHRDVVRILFPITNETLCDYKGTSPLVDATTAGRVEMCKLLLETKYEYFRSRSNSHIPELHFDIFADVEPCPLSWDNLHSSDDILEGESGGIVIRLAASRRYVNVMKMLYKCLDPDAPSISLLHQAAADCLAFPVVSLILAQGADVTAQNEFGYTALHVAAENDNLAAAQVLLLADASCPKPIKRGELDMVFARQVQQLHSLAVNVQNNAGQTALHLAARGGHGSLVESLVLARANVNMADLDGVTPLHFACCMGRQSVVQQLLTSGAYTEVKGNWGTTTAKKHHGVTPLHVTILENEISICELLLDYSADVNSPLTYYKTTTPPLHLAISRGQWDFVKLLISAGSSVNDPDSPLKSALHKQRPDDIVKTLHVNSADPTSPLKSALHEQAPAGVIKMLLMSGADPNGLFLHVPGPSLVVQPIGYRPERNSLMTPLEWAVCSYIPSRMIPLLLDFGGDVNFRKPNGRTVLHDIVHYLADTRNRSLKGLESLLKISRSVERKVEGVQTEALSTKLQTCICDLNATDSYGDTILFIALNGKYDDCVKLLLKYWEKPVFVNGTGDTLLRLAVAKRTPAIVRHLLELGASLDDPLAWRQVLRSQEEEMLLLFAEFVDEINFQIPLETEPPADGSLLHYALLYSSEFCVNMILSLKLVDVNCLDSLGRTPLYLALTKNRNTSVLSLLADGASVGKSLEYSDSAGRDLVHILSSTSQKMFLSLLVLHTPDIDRRAAEFQTEKGVTALHIAAIVGQPEVVDVLLRAGSDITCVTANGKDSALLALEHGHKLLSQHLESLSKGKPKDCDIHVSSVK